MFTNFLAFFLLLGTVPYLTIFYSSLLDPDPAGKMNADREPWFLTNAYYLE